MNTEKEKLELQPCPFCGGEVYVLPHKNDKTKFVLFHDIDENITCPIAVFDNDTLGVFLYETAKEAADMWNTRFSAET